MLIEIMLVICAVLMTFCGMYFTIFDIRAKIIKKRATKRYIEEMKKEPLQVINTAQKQEENN